jgi:hypothetical protein
MASWWEQFQITQGFGQNGERGTDYGVPFHTPLELPFGGQVVSEGYHGWGGEVDVATFVPGLGKVTESILHLDQILVPQGAEIPAGGVVGLSGGQLSGGLHPNDPKFSSGPHTEIDFWKGAPWASQSFDPASILAGTPDPGIQLLGLIPQARPPGAPGAFPNAPDPAAAAAAQDPFGVQAGLQHLGDQVGSIPTTIGHGIADFIAVAEKDTGEWLKKQAIAFFVAAVVLLVLFA